MEGNGRDQPTYTLPGVLHFIKHEWSKFERERAAWDSERAEFQAKIAFLQGERKGQENLKRDLVRRIKMLEYALKQERIKNYELVYGKTIPFSDLTPPDLEKPNKEPEPTVPSAQRASKNILKSYLKEIGFPDYVLDTRVSRVRAVKSTGVQPASPTAASDDMYLDQPKPSPPKRVDSYEKLLQVVASPQGLVHHPETSSSKRVHIQSEPGTVQASSPPPKLKSEKTTAPASSPVAGGGAVAEQEELTLDVEEALVELDQVLNNEDDDSDSSDEDGSSADDELESPETGFDEDQMEDEPAEEFTFSRVGGGSPSSSSGVDHSSSSDSGADVHSRPGRAGGGAGKGQKSFTRPSRKELKNFEKEMKGQGPERYMPGTRGEAIGLPDDQDLVAWIRDEPEPSNGGSKKWTSRYTMRSHLDAVTCVGFHPLEPILVTGSEDKTLKVWSLQQSSRAALIDGEPIHTLRGHTGAILALATAREGDLCFSAGADCTIHSWKLPVECEPFDEYNPCVHSGELEGHTDAVWDLAVHPKSPTLLSCSADGTCRLWSTDHARPCLSTLPNNPDLGIPTSCDFLHHNLRQMVVSYSTAQTVIYDVETSQIVTKLNSSATYDGSPRTQINKVRCHPTLPLVVTAHEDKCIRFFDAVSGAVQHEMVAHMESVSGLAMDPNGLYLLSASHDGSLRFWNVDNYICIQEVTAHRKRYDEAVFNVACHPHESMFASAGADSVVKVFV